MIKDIGTEGLRVIDVAPKSHMYDLYKQMLYFNIGKPAIFPDGVEMEVIDITTFGDKERKFMQAYPESTGPR